MRWLLLVALVGCGTETPPAGGASLVLDIPNGMLDPQGYSTVEITLHEANGDTVRSAAVGTGGTFDLGDIDPRNAVSIEAALRDESGAAVGYGRTARAVDLAADATITVPVRRPIVYIAGLNYMGAAPNYQWFGLPATFSDLSSGATLDGSTMVAAKPVLMVSAGPNLYAIDQEPLSPSGVLSGPATIRGVSTGDHSLSAQLAGTMTGAVQDGAGSDDGSTLVVGTSAKLFVIDATPGAAVAVREIASGDFDRVAMVNRADGSLGAVAIKNRVATTGACTATAELWWIASTGGEVVDAKMIAVGGFADVASEGGRAWYVDACKGELGEVLAEGPRMVRGGLGKPTAIAVSNGQAWIGVERAAPTTMSLVVVPLEAAGMPRTLWTERQDQILEASSFPGVQRRLDAQTSTFQQLEIGAGGDYVVASISGAFHGDAVFSANFPRMEIVTEEVRIFDAASGGVIVRYRSWCDGSYFVAPGDIDLWRCALTTGQTAPTTIAREHRISSTTFLFGKK